MPSKNKEIYFDMKKYCVFRLFITIGMLYLVSLSVLAKNSNNILRVAVPEQFPPQYTLDSKGKPTGFAIEVFNVLAKKINRPVEYVVKKNWTEVFKALQSGEADVIPNVGVSDKRKNSFNYTRPVETFSLIITVRASNKSIQNLADLQGMRVVTVKGNVAISFLRKKGGMEVIIKDSVSEALFEVLSGNADALVYPRPWVEYVVHQSGLSKKIKFIGQPLLEINRAIAVAKGNQVLLSRLNVALTSLQLSDEYRAIYYRWHAIPASSWTVKNIIWLSFAVLLVLTLVLVTIHYRLVLKMNRSLRENKEKYRSLVESASAIPWEVDLVTWQFTYVGPQAEKILGYPVSKWYEKNFWPEHIAEEDRETAVRYCKNTTSRGEDHVFEYRMISADGRIVWIRDAVTVILEDGKPSRLQGYMFDITESRKSDARQALFASILDNSANEIYIFDSQSLKFTHVSQGARKNLGFTLSELKNMTPLDLKPAMTHTAFKKLLKPLINNEYEYIIFETLHQRKNSTIYPVEIHLQIIKGVGGVDQYVAIILDITERKKSLSKQQKHEAELNYILDNMVDGVLTINEKGIVLSFNRAAEVIFGYTADEMIGTNVSRLIPEPVSSKHDDYLKNYLETGQSKVIGHSVDVTGQKKDDTQFPIRLSAAELPFNEGMERRFIASVVDLTEHVQKENQLRRAQKMDALGKLTGGVAHDYNNMLGVILGYTEMLELKLEKEPTLLKYVHEIRHAGERGVGLTRKLLAFSRNRSTGAVRVNVNDVLRENSEMLEKSLTARIKLELGLQPDLWAVNLDKGDLEDAVLNLCINASHSMSAGGQLSIKTENTHLDMPDADIWGVKEGDYIKLSITDTGSGIESEVLTHIFEPFFTTKKDQGTGLGLSQVYGFIKRSHGEIKVHSEPGHGTCFSLLFPRIISSVIEGTPDETDVSRLDLLGYEVVLVVDDERALRTLAQEILTKHGYHVLLAESGKQALEILDKHQVDIVFSDVIMPEMDGYQLSNMINDKYPKIKIQLASGFTGDLESNVNDKSLVSGLLSKPYSSIELLQKIRFLLDK